MLSTSPGLKACQGDMVIAVVGLLAGDHDLILVCADELDAKGAIEMSDKVGLEDKRLVDCV
jgi:hypothetical protein